MYKSENSAGIKLDPTDTQPSAPFKNDNAIKYDSLSYKKVIDDELKVMDLTAITLCKENKLPISVININNKNNLESFLFSSNIIGTIIT